MKTLVSKKQKCSSRKYFISLFPLFFFFPAQKARKSYEIWVIFCANWKFWRFFFQFLLSVKTNRQTNKTKTSLPENILTQCFLSFSFQPKGKKVLRNLSYVLCQVEVLAFLFAFLMAGILWGYLENFLFWHLEDLGATKFLMGTYWKIYYLSKSDHVFFFVNFWIWMYDY